MKKIKHLFSILFASSILFLASCQPDNDDDATPTDDRDKFVATWSCAENSSQNGTSTFDVHIKKSSNANDVVIENFYNYGFNKSAVASISGSSITIGSQSFSGSNTIHGSGSLSGNNKINMTYYVNDGSATDTVSAVLTKK